MYLVAGLVRMLRGWHRYNEYVNAGVKLHRLAGAKLHQVGFDASWIGIRGTDGRCARSRARSSPAAAERRALGRGALRRERAPSHHSRAAMRAVV